MSGITDAFTCVYVYLVNARGNRKDFIDRPLAVQID